ncbi:MAG TPA: ribose 5-phosphate isomerase B, partial [bacterium]|nr:ribose 5-phosphate isomerase B [bacterium]
MSERIVVSSDHAGWELKERLKPFLQTLGYEVEDVGTYSTDPVDYPIYTQKAAERVAAGACRRGIVCCGTGQGDAMVANKVPGIRAALCWDLFTARLSRAHNDANMLVLGGWLTAPQLAEEMVRVWLATPFDGGRHARRVEEITEFERAGRLARGRLYDISRTIAPGMLLWPGEQDVEFQRTSLEGIPSLTRICLSAHAGSHLDAPAHVLVNGTGADRVDLQSCLGLARVCQLPGARTLDRATLAPLSLQGVTRLLLGTRGSAMLQEQKFHQDYVTFTEDGARYLVEQGVKLVALDYLSIDEFTSHTYPVHHVLLEAGVTVIEGVDLGGVPGGDYELLCLPLKLAG